MAVNRMYLACRACGATFYLAKIMCSGYYGEVDNEALNEFYDDHAFCMEDRVINYENQFEIRYESAKEPGMTEADGHVYTQEEWQARNRRSRPPTFEEKFKVIKTKQGEA